MDADRAPSPLVEGRECGGCTACCVALTIQEPALSKPQGFRCRHLVAAAAGGGCGIYPDRPTTCRTFHCGWRQFRWVRETLRPDLSGVLIRRHREQARDTGQSAQGVIFSLLGRHGLRAEGLAETVAAAVHAGVPAYLGVQGPPGHTSGVARMNEALEQVVRFRDKPGLLAILRRAYASASHSGNFRPIDMAKVPPTSEP